MQRVEMSAIAKSYTYKGFKFIAFCQDASLPIRVFCSLTHFRAIIGISSINLYPRLNSKGMSAFLPLGFKEACERSNIGLGHMSKGAYDVEDLMRFIKEESCLFEQCNQDDLSSLSFFVDDTKLDISARPVQLANFNLGTPPPKKKMMFSANLVTVPTFQPGQAVEVFCLLDGFAFYRYAYYQKKVNDSHAQILWFDDEVDIVPFAALSVPIGPVLRKDNGGCEVDAFTQMDGFRGWYPAYQLGDVDGKVKVIPKKPLDGKAQLVLCKRVHVRPARDSKDQNPAKLKRRKQ